MTDLNSLSFHFSACFKDAITVYLVYQSYNRFYVEGGLPDDRQNKMNFFIYLAGFTLEDCGQVLLQFYFQERYQTQVNIFTIFNSVFMVLMSFKTLISLTMYSVDKATGEYK